MTRCGAVFLVMAGLFATPDVARCQPASGSMRKEVIASGVLMAPVGAFHRALPTIGGGGGFHALFARRARPVAFGVDGQLLFYSPPDHQDEMILTAHGVVRVRRPLDRRRPFVEAIGGIKGFSAEGSSRVGTYSYGAGAGIQFPVGRSKIAGPGEREVYEIGVRYLRGGGAHLDAQHIASSTHTITVHVGWGLEF